MKTEDWISVKDRLPDFGLTVIVAWTDHVTVGWLHSDNHWYPGHPAPYDIPVEYWMPLPSAPLPPK